MVGAKGNTVICRTNALTPHFISFLPKRGVLLVSASVQYIYSVVGEIFVNRLYSHNILSLCLCLSVCLCLCLCVSVCLSVSLSLSLSRVSVLRPLPHV